MKSEFLNQFSKYSQTSNFMRIHPVGAKLFYTDSWMERQIRQKRDTFCNFANTPNNFMFFVPCIVIQLCIVNQQNARFLNYCFNSILPVFYIFRTSCVHHQEDHMSLQFFMVCFSFIYLSSLAGGRMCSSTLIYKWCILVVNIT
jgi:hypothetical protein